MSRGGRLLALAATLVTGYPSGIRAQEAAHREAPRDRLVLDLPILDLPDNTTSGFAFPSMQQSLAISRAFDQLASRALDRVFTHDGIWTDLARIAVETIVFSLPFSDAWLHEEWHRAVLRNRGVGSFNDVYKLQIFSQFISVSHIKDEDLVRLKRDHPADQVRLAEAGMEGEYEQVTEGTRDRIFLNANPEGDLTRALSVVNSIFYLGTSTFASVDRATDNFHREEGTDVARRDALGWDFTAWIYDLSRPNEPYEARGLDPSGVGIDRYIKTTDLTSEELRFLRLQGWLGLLNLVDPNLFGQHPFTAGETKFTFGLRHLLTSFGYTLDANLFFKRGDTNLFAVIHTYANHDHYFPGVDLEIVRRPFTVGATRLDVSPRLAAWLQPEDQRFRSSSATPGGLASLRIGSVSKPGLGWFVELRGKTEGWVAGEVNVGSTVGTRLGMSAVLR